jgi:hypothetical protein
MRGSGQRRKRDSLEDVGSQLLLSFGLLECLLPVGGSELEQAIVGPSADEAEQVADVAVRFDAPEACAGEKRNEGGVCEGAIVAARRRAGFERGGSRGTKTFKNFQRNEMTMAGRFAMLIEAGGGVANITPGCGIPKRRRGWRT